MFGKNAWQIQPPSGTKHTVANLLSSGFSFASSLDHQPQGIWNVIQHTQWLMSIWRASINSQNSHNMKASFSLTSRWTKAIPETQLRFPLTTRQTCTYLAYSQVGLPIAMSTPGELETIWAWPCVMFSMFLCNMGTTCPLSFALLKASTVPIKGSFPLDTISCWLELHPCQRFQKLRDSPVYRQLHSSTDDFCCAQERHEMIIANHSNR